MQRTRCDGPSVMDSVKQDQFFSPEHTTTPMQKWLAFRAEEENGKYCLNFNVRHIGNPLVKTIHGGVTASFIEMCSQHCLTSKLGKDTRISLLSSNVDYLRITKDADIHGRAQIVRSSRRLAFIDVWCWQDDEDIPIAHGTCNLRIFPQQAS